MLIGSRALAHWCKDFKVNPKSDWDFIGEQTIEVPKGDNIEIHDRDFLNNKRAVELFNKGGVCSVLGLTKIKRSHLWRDYKFDKHITHYHKFLLPELHKGMVDSFDELMGAWKFGVERTKLTKKAFRQGNPSLNKTNEEFFDDAVDKVYDHDWLHELYAYEDAPMYEKLKKPNQLGQAWCEKDLWMDLTVAQRQQCVAEECYVIATERFLVPKGFDFPYKLAYLNALKKVCTTLTSGWFRDYAIDNYPSIVELYDVDKINQVRNQL